MHNAFPTPTEVAEFIAALIAAFSGLAKLADMLRCKKTGTATICGRQTSFEVFWHISHMHGAWRCNLTDVQTSLHATFGDGTSAMGAFDVCRDAHFVPLLKARGILK